MGSYVRIYRMPDGLLIGYHAEQGGYLKFAVLPQNNKVVYAYVNPEDDHRFELIAAVRSPKSVLGTWDAILVKDNRTGAVRTSKAEFLGVAYEVGQNRYMMGRTPLQAG